MSSAYLLRITREIWTTLQSRRDFPWYPQFTGLISLHVLLTHYYIDSKVEKLVYTVLLLDKVHFEE